MKKKTSKLYSESINYLAVDNAEPFVGFAAVDGLIAAAVADVVAVAAAANFKHRSLY